MKFQRTIKGRSPDLVIAELMKILKPEVEIFWQTESRIIMFGLITPYGKATRADMTILAFHNIHNSTTIDVELEDRPTRAHRVEDRNHQIHSILQEIFDAVCERLNCALPQLSMVDEATDGSDLYTETEVLTEESPVSKESGTHSAQKIPRALSLYASIKALLSNSLAKLSFVNLFVPRAKANIYLGRLTLLRPAFFQQMQFATAGGVAVLVACLTIGVVHFRTTHSNAIHPYPLPTDRPKLPQVSANNSPISERVAAAVLTPHNKAQHQQQTEETIPQLTPSHNVKSVNSLIEEWAAAQRTRDAKAQASFYADKVDPYLGHGAATRSDVLHYKQDAIRDRNGLWAFKIENVSVHRQAQNTAIVNLRKHLMTQTGAVEVAEQFIPSRLTVQRTHGSWSIVQEQDLSLGTAKIR
ncbi:MAG: nuclear transport factor 2 family protein [Granulicella sp.]